MRSLKMTLAVLLTVGLGAVEASAFDYTLTPRNFTSGDTVDIGDTLIVDVFLDAEVGLTLLSLGVLFDFDDELVYDGPAAAALPPQGVGTSGAQPSYILYAPGMLMSPATVLYPQQTPYWLNWAGNLPPGQDQVNLNYAESALNAAAASGTGLYIATLVFQVDNNGDGASTISLCNTCGGNTLTTGGSPPVIVDPGTIGLSPDVTVTVPEASAAGLATVALMTLGILGGRRRRA